MTGILVKRPENASRDRGKRPHATAGFQVGGHLRTREHVGVPLKCAGVSIETRIPLNGRKTFVIRDRGTSTAIQLRDNGAGFQVPGRGACASVPLSFD